MTEFRTTEVVNERQAILERHLDEIAEEFMELGLTPLRAAVIVLTKEVDHLGMDVSSGYGIAEDGDATELIVDLLSRCITAAERTA